MSLIYNNVELPFDLYEFIEYIDSLIVVFDSKGIMVACNDATAQMITQVSGKQIYEFLGQNVDTFPEKNLNSDWDLVTPEVIKTKDRVMKNIYYKNGLVITYTGIPFFSDGEIKFIILTGRDMTELSLIEQQLRVVRNANIEYINKIKKLENEIKDEEIIYSSKKIEDLLKMMNRVAKTSSSVFIMGESGVGKEEFAKFIHKKSERSDIPLVAINCAAIPSELLESELFGYEEGAFTGSKRGGKKGILEMANGGTLLLDEIGDLPIQLQSKLLRVIQEQKYMRLGGNLSIPLDIRYISTTNLSYEKLTNNSVFRQDLYYRLSIIPITIPPIRERKEDVLPLAIFFLNKFNLKYNRHVKLSKDAIQALFNYSWRGNVREIKNIIERLVILTVNNIIESEDLKMALNLDPNNTSEKSIVVNEIIPLGEAYKLVDNELINKALKLTNNNILKASRLLQIDASTIHRKIKNGMISI